LHKRFSEMPLVSISEYQRRYLPTVKWEGTVYHGLPSNLYSCSASRGDYLAFLGRICSEKRLDRAIEIATRAGMKLKVAAKIDPADRDYFHEVIEPLLDNPLIECVGEINERQKQDFLGNARALLFPIDWPEPFGLVLIEAMACGTPVIAFRAGSVPEIVEEGVTGFIVDDVEQAVAALSRLDGFDRKRCRAAFEARFSDRRMTQAYLQIYQRLLERRRPLSANYYETAPNPPRTVFRDVGRRVVVPAR
jgi:glycosyltransferase involved in cell wall biosynthesis